MLYVFVNKEQTEVYYATYDHEMMQQFCRYRQIKLVARYFNDVEIYAVLENDN